MKRIAVLLVLGLSLASLPGRAAEQGAAPSTEKAGVSDDRKPLWAIQVGLSYLETDGNSETRTLGLDLQMNRRPTPWGMEITALFNRAEENGQKTAERRYASLRATRRLAERWNLIAGPSAEQDDFAGIDLRSLFEAGAVYKALVGPRHTLKLDLAATWTNEQRLAPEVDDSWLGGLAGLEYKLAISDSATFSQNLRYFASFDDPGNWRADSLSAVTAALNKRLALRFSYEVRHRNEPVGDAKATDTTTKVSLVWKV
jgi:putative salt-induced outer membrane protein